MPEVSEKGFIPDSSPVVEGFMESTYYEECILYRSKYQRPGPFVLSTLSGIDTLMDAKHEQMAEFRRFGVVG